MPLPADSILTVLCGRIAARPHLSFTEHEHIPVLSFKVEVSDRAPQIYEPITKRVLLIGAKDADPATDPVLRASEALAPGQRVTVFGAERRREWFLPSAFMRGAQIEAAEVHRHQPTEEVFRLGRPGDGIE